ncbi:MAG: ArsR family transcriptional regulator, partial [Chloroflexota bacterium]
DAECCVDPMAECLGLPQPFVSRHLAILREAGVVSCTVEGRRRRESALHSEARSSVVSRHLIKF